MRPLETVVLYLLVGACVAIAFVLRRDAKSGIAWLRVLAAPIFWPLLVPLLLIDAQAKPVGQQPVKSIGGTRLTAALAGLNSVADEIALPDIARVRAHAGSIAALEGRVTEMDGMLRTPEFDRAAAERTLSDLLSRNVPESDARVGSVRSRLRNIDRLQALRRRAAEDIERVCLQIEEMTAQLKLLRFAGSSADGESLRAIRQVADAMESTTDALLTAEMPEASRPA